MVVKGMKSLTKLAIDLYIRPRTYPGDCKLKGFVNHHSSFWGQFLMKGITFKSRKEYLQKIQDEYVEKMMMNKLSISNTLMSVEENRRVETGSHMETPESHFFRLSIKRSDLEQELRMGIIFPSLS